MSVTAAFPGKAAFVSVDADNLALQAWEPRTLADTPTTGLAEADVHVWLLQLQQPPHTLEDLATSLTEEERARSSRFHLERDRKRFIAARGLLRQLVGQYTDMPANAVRFLANSHGKPHIETEEGLATFEFNLSHSGDWVVVGFARGAAVGVDIEQIRPMPDMADVARHTFAASEAASIEALPDDQRIDGFFSCWTRKEAYVKAVGLGLSVDLKTFNVHVTPTRHVDNIRYPDTGAVYRVEGLRPLQGYLSAIAVEIPGAATGVFASRPLKHFTLAT
ncbi:MAG: 4'-phosphopantetheinyl transferase superfamily protein [Alphaproteobacteria bacterium]|nr:MAG: 4'-phosphopantetheinyl transferase superfamily protein [Alphaproteobacteria bacterium]